MLILFILVILVILNLINSNIFPIFPSARHSLLIVESYLANAVQLAKLEATLVNFAVVPGEFGIVIVH